jgi:DNA repair protein RecO
MHHIHHTEAFVLGSSPKGEDSKLLKLYTRELGLVYAHAQAVRKLSSKLRFTLQDFSLATVDLVRGREIWRVTTAVPVHAYANIRKDRASERILARVNSLLVRLVTGEEPSEEIFSILERTYELLERGGYTPEEHRTLELFSVARILIALGYLSRETMGEQSLFEPANAIPATFSDVSFQHRLIRDINQALMATQL